MLGALNRHFPDDPEIGLDDKTRSIWPVLVGRAMGKNTHTLECASEETDGLGEGAMTLYRGFFVRASRSLLGSIGITRHPPDDGLVEAEIAAFGGYWQCQFLDMNRGPCAAN